MDLNDPRRRLQVLNNSNPSLRVATAPQPKITIAQPKAPNVTITQPKAAPLPQQSQSIPLPKPGGGLPDMEFKGISEGPGKNKTIFGWNAAAVLPKGYEKTYEVKTDRNITTNKDKFVAQYDKLHPEYQKVLVNKSRELAAQGDVAAINTIKALEETNRLKGNLNDFAEGANDKLYGGLSRGFLRGVDFVLPGKNTFGMEALADDQDPSKKGTQQITSAGKAGETFGSVEKGIVDLATLALGGGVAEKAATKAPAFANLLDKLSKGGRVSRLAGRMVQSIPGSLAGSGISSVQTAGRGDEQNFGKDLAIGTAVDLGLPILGSTFRATKNLFKSGADDALSHGVIKDLIDEIDPVKIERALGVDKEMATYLANETNPETVKQILADLAVDPNFNISDDLRKRLQEEGITSVGKSAEDDPYAASFRDGKISAKSQKDLDENIYHEIGHSVWKNRLTPEERALFTGQGAASKQAVGRAGYTADDVNAEDFSDYMNKALTGRMKEVPQEYQDVIAKYAKVAKAEVDNAGAALPKEYQEAIKEAGGTVPDPGTVFHLPQAGVHAKLSPEQADFLKDEVNNIPWSKGDMPHLTAGDKVREATKEVSLEELATMSPNVKAALANADNAIKATNPEAAVAKEAEAVSKAQTGTVEGLAEGTGDVEGAGLKGNTELGNTTPEQVQEALDKGDIAGLLPAKASPGPIANDGPNGFVVNNADPKYSKEIAKIDKQLEKVRQGNSNLTPAEVRALTARRAELAAQANGAPAPVEAPKDVKRYKATERAMEGSTPKTVEELIPEGTDPETAKSVQDFLDSINREGGTLDRAEVGYNAAQRARSKETGARIGKGQSLYQEAGGGEQGFRSKLSALRGKKTDSGYTPISVDPKVETHMLDAVEKSGLRPYEKLNTQNAMRKVWGANPEKPTASDINNIRTFLNKNFGEGKGDEFAEGITEALKAGRDWKDVASEVAGLPRALMATGDLSGGFRQAMPLGSRFPKQWARANKLSVEWAASPAKYEKAMKEIADHPNYQAVQDLMGVDLTGIGAMQDEAFIGAGMAEKIPVAGIGVKAADRAYTGVLTKLRWDVANKIIEDAGGVDKFMKNIEDVAGDKSKEYLRSWGEVINTLTGRGGKKGGMLDQHMKTLSTGLFAPRLWAANINRLNPVWYARLAKTNPQAAKLAIQSQGTFLAMAGSILGIASAAGADVGTDPRSADFGKIKVGNTRYDVLGGQQQNIVQAVRQFTGEKVNSETGEVQELGDGFGAKTRFDLAIDMLNNKANPLLGFGIKLMNTKEGESGNPLIREDQYGNEFNIATEGVKLVTPLGAQGAVETSKDVGNPIKGTLMNAPSFFGVGVQTYGSTPTKDQGQDENGKLVFKGKQTPEMVTDNAGNVMLDEKGKPVKVKFDKNATEMEKQAAIISARKSAYKDQAKRLLSDNDRGIYKMGEADKGQLDEQQLKKYNQIKKWVNDYGQDTELPEGANDTATQNFYKKYNTMSEEDQEAWLKESPDDNSKEITTLLNKQRSKGLDEYKPSNELAKAYAEYQKDLSTHPEYTDVDKRNKAKAFQTHAYKLNFTEDQRDIFAEGGSADLKTLAEEGQLSKADLDAAIKLDNDLYNSGLTGSLKFSKTFRKTFGYGLPDGGGVNQRLSFSGSGSGSSDSVNQHLLSYLPSKSSSGGAPAPQFSSKRRGGGLSFKDVNAPSKTNNKKISINL